jgi:peptidase A4-like protein
MRGSATSSNWAGYAVTPTPGGSVTSFSNVYGSWVQPAVSCSSGAPSFSAFWVGLGGVTEGSTSLEQIGTAADCTASGTPTYSAWYEILPAPPVWLRPAITPGDRVSAAVTVSARTVSVRLRNLTRHTVANAKRKLAAPDLTSAEWIAEAPSTCTGSGRCTTLPIANFGSVDFLQAAATGSGHSGLIADPAWTAWQQAPPASPGT